MKITIKNLTERAPWTIAKDNRLCYSGDASPIPHGGTFYETSNWTEYGYAECVRIQESEGTLWVESGTINKYGSVANVLATSGWKLDEAGQVVCEHDGSVVANELTPEIEAECNLSYWGMEVDHTETFQERDYGFNEIAIMRVVKSLLLAIVPPDPMPPVGEIRSLLISLKADIQDDYIADDDSEHPSLCVTIGADGKGRWSYQTGDNSFTGGAYGMPHWAVITLDRKSNCTELANDVLDQLADLIGQ